MNQEPSVILHVEDDEDDVLLLQHAFEKAGIKHPLHVARNGQQAIEYLSAIGPFSECSKFPGPCLIILDLMIPRMTGFEVLRWVRTESELPYTPVIVFSSSAQTADIDKAYELGANACVIKPASTQARLKLATALKEFWLELNHVPANCGRTSLAL